MKNRPIAVDLFAGAGGLGLGFEQAGYDVMAAIEIDPIHAAIHKYNFPECTVIPKPIEKISADEIRGLSGIGSKNIEIVFGGPPCQGFSLIGKRMLDDPRNGLVMEFLRIVTELSPSYFLFENVKGLTVGKHRMFLKELVDKFQEKGYQIRVPWRVLNAADYGVPQDRERLFLLGAKEGLRIPDYPEANTFSRTKNGNPALLESGPTCRDALGDLPEAEQYDELNMDDAVFIDVWGEPSEYSRQLRCIDEDSWHYGYKRFWEPNLLTSSARTDHTEVSRQRFARTKPGEIEPISRFFKLSADGISNTLRAGTDSARGAFTSPRPIHYERNRCITVREMARLHGFPDWFRFHKTKWHGARQIGNAVPPPLARKIAVGFTKASGIIPTRPEKVLYLDDPRFLSMTMTNAAAYWGVEVPIGKRDRKNGTRKRKQEEIENAISYERTV